MNDKSMGKIGIKFTLNLIQPKRRVLTEKFYLITFTTFLKD